MSVVRLMDRVDGITPDNEADLWDWLAKWVEELRTPGKYQDIRSLSLVIEAADGNVVQLSQSVKKTDGMRLVGLFTVAAHRVAHGGGQIEELKR